MNADEMTCEELVELVTSYLEQALAPPERVRFEEHLAECTGCRAYVDQMKHIIRLLGTLPAELIALEAKQSLLDAFRTWKSSQAR